MKPVDLVKPCGINWCVALAAVNSEFCTVHTLDPNYVPTREDDNVLLDPEDDPEDEDDEDDDDDDDDDDDEVSDPEDDDADADETPDE
jgi:hypothetical protein